MEYLDESDISGGKGKHKKKGGDMGLYGDKSKMMKMGCNILCLVLILVIAYMVYNQFICKRDNFLSNEEGTPNVPYGTGTLRMMVDGSVGRDGRDYETVKMARPNSEGFGNTPAPRLSGNVSTKDLSDMLHSGAI